MTDIRAIETNGVGRQCDSHLNLTVTLADADRAEAYVKRAWRTKAKMGRPKGPLEPTKIPYAGKGSK